MAKDHRNFQDHGEDKGWKQGFGMDTGILNSLAVLYLSPRHRDHNVNRHSPGRVSGLSINSRGEESRADAQSKS